METPYYDPLRPNEYYYTPIQRAQRFWDLSEKEKSPKGGIPAVRTEDTAVLSTVNVTGFITFHDIKFPGTTSTDELDGSWGYVYNLASGELLLEAFFDDQRAIGKGLIQYRHFPVLFKTSEAPPLSSRDAGWLYAASPLIPIPILQTDKASDLRCFLSPLPLHASCLATMEANGKKVIRQNFIPARVGLRLDRPILIATCIEPFSWAHDAKVKYYDETLNAFLAGEADKDIRYRHLIAQSLKAAIDKGDKYDLDHSRIFSKKPFLEIDDLGREANERKAAIEQASAYMSATCYDGDDFRLVEQAALIKRIDTVEYLGVTWQALLVGLNLAEPGRQFVAQLVKDPLRFFAQQIYTPFPIFNLKDAVTQNAGTARWLWYACAGNVSETIVAYHRMAIQKSLNKLTEYQRLENYLGQLGMRTVAWDALNATKAAVQRSGQPGKVVSDVERSKIFQEILAQGKVITEVGKSDLVLANARLLEDVDRVIDVKNVIAEEKAANRFLGTLRGKKCLLYIKSTIVSGKHIFDLVSLLLAADALAGATEENSTNAKVALLGSSSDFLALALETAGAGRAIANKQLLWGRIPWQAAKGVGGVLGVVSGFCDGYSMTTEFSKGWSRDDAGRMVGASIGLVGAGMEIAGGVIVLSELYLGSVIIAGSWAGPVGIAIGAVAAAFLAVGAIVIASQSLNNPWQEFAAHSFLGKRKDSDWVQYDWAPTGKFMPCKTYDRKNREYDEELKLLLSLVTSYIIRLEDEFNPVTFSAGAASNLIIEFPVADPSHEVFISIEQVWEWNGPDGYDRLTFTTAKMHVTRDHEGMSDIFGDDTLALWPSKSELTGDAPALAKIKVELQPNFVRENPGGHWARVAELIPKTGRLYYDTTIRKVTVKVRVTSQTNISRPYGDTYILPVYEFRDFPRRNIAVQSGWTWQLPRQP